MESVRNNTKPEQISEIPISEDLKYDGYLKERDFKFKENGPYLLVGEIPALPEWHFHIAIIRQDLPYLLECLLPVLKEKNLPFKVAKDDTAAHQILSGKWGHQVFGKVISIYPIPGMDLNAMAETLIPLTNIYKGPAINTAAHLGGLLFTQYHGNTPFSANLWPFNNQFPNPVTKKQVVFQGKYGYLYRITKVIKSDLKGNVYTGIYPKYILWAGKCVIKEGKKNMWTDNSRRDMRSRLLWQKEVHESLQGHVHIPRIIDLFTDDGNTYLVMEYINGQTLGDILEKYYAGQSWKVLTNETKKELIGLVIKIIEMIRKVHDAGFIHRDITPANFLITQKKEIYLIDLELAYNFNKSTPDPPYGNGTFGFMSPEQHDRRPPTYFEDIYGLGGFIISMITGKGPDKFTFQDHNKLIEELIEQDVNNKLASVIAKCYQENPNHRPELKDIKSSVYNFYQTL